MKGVKESVESMVLALAKPQHLSALYELAREAGIVKNRRQLTNALYTLARQKLIAKTGNGKASLFGPPGAKRAKRASGTTDSGAIKKPVKSAPLWALTSNGAFILLGTEVEIPRPAAHALVTFIDTLRQGAA